MFEIQSKIDTVLSKSGKAFKEQSCKKKKFKVAFEMLIKKALNESKKGCTEKTIASWIKKRNDVDSKILVKVLKRVLKRLLKVKRIYVSKRRPITYQLTPKGKQMKQADKRVHHAPKKAQKINKKKKKSKTRSFFKH